jgi:DNA-binding XRE family transcriptional regulator
MGMSPIKRVVEDVMDEEPQVNPLGVRLQHYREQHGWGRRTAATTAGLAESTVRNLEQGYMIRSGRRDPYTPESGTVWALATAVGMPDHEVLELAVKSGVQLDPKPQVIRLDLAPVPWEDIAHEIRRRALADADVLDDLQMLVLEVATQARKRKSAARD